MVYVTAYLAACYKWGDWRNWREYYPTVLYVIIGDLSYNFVFYQHTLWKYQGLVNHTVSDYLVALLVFPAAVILYLTYYPRGKYQTLYILLWTLANSMLEHASVKLGYFSYNNGWNIYWSALVFYIAFILVRLHYLKPLLVWPLSVACGLVMMAIFHVPITSLK